MAFLGGPRLLDWASSPPHLQFNRFVLTGYRPVSSGSGCLRSLFYLHNELGNIYTHGFNSGTCEVTDVSLEYVQSAFPFHHKRSLVDR
uniref:Progestin and adipoQ receptor member 4 n=1 Tax=Sphaerodactylus townsendi TaxID=933632 RepID=A0ACB8EUY0_9SAUR